MDAQHRRRDAIPAPEQPHESWWLGLDREAFKAKQAEQQPRMHGLAGPQRPNLSTAVDHRVLPRVYPTSYWEDL